MTNGDKMKKRSLIKYLFMILAVALIMLTAFSSCSADNSSIKLCNIQLNTEEASRSFDKISFTSNLLDCNLVYCATYTGSGVQYGDTNGEYIPYDTSKGLILSQGLWVIDCKWTKLQTQEDGTTNEISVAEGSTGAVWVNLNTKFFSVFLNDDSGAGSVSIKYNVKCKDNSVNNVSFEYSITKWNSPSSQEIITISGSPDYSVGSEQFSLRVLSLPINHLDSGKYLLSINIYDEDTTSNNLLYTDVLGFVVRTGFKTEINGECYVNKYTSDKNEYIYWEEQPSNPQKTENVGGNNNTALNSVKKIATDTIYIVNSDSNNNMNLGHTEGSSKSNRIVTPSANTSFGINLNGTSVYLTTFHALNGGTKESSLVIDLPTTTEMTLYNYSVDNPAMAVWAEIKPTQYLYGSYSRRFEANVTMSGGKLNIVGPDSPSELSNGIVKFKGPVATDSDDTETLFLNSTRKQGAINFNSEGGTVVVDGNVEFEASVGFSSWSTNKPETAGYEDTINSSTNVNITIKNGANVSVIGDKQTDDRWIDTAYGVYLRGNSTGSNGTINILLDNGMINASKSGSNEESGIRIDNYVNGTINITLKNEATISSDVGSGLYFNNCQGSTINVMIQSDDPDSVITGAPNKIRIGGTSTFVNLIITNPTTGETKKAVISKSVSSFTTGLTFTQI